MDVQHYPRARDTIVDFIVGGKDMIGHGSLMFNSCLSTFRGISLSALGSAIGKVGFKNITTYSVIRKKFGLPMEEFDGVEENLAKIGGYTYMLESIRNLTLTAFNMGYNSGIITAMAKCSITELSRKIINAAMDVSGSRATMLGANNYLARLYQSIPISIAMDGSNNLLKNTMIFQVGSIKCHPFLTAELEAVDTNNVKMFDQHFLAHISYALSNFAKMVLHSCSNKIFCLGFKHQLINKHFKKYCKNLSFFSIVLSCLVELSFLKYGVSLKQNERLSSRLVDVWSYIYMGCAVVKYHSKNTIDSDDVVFATWCLQKCLHEIQQSIIKVLQNFSNKFLAKILAFIIFPFGKNYEAPNDISEHSISNIMIKNTAIRTRLLSGSYIASDDRWEVAFKKMLNIAVLSKKIDLAEKSGVIPKNIDLDLTINMAVQEKILTELEANLIKEAELAVNDAMKVDEFSVNNL